MSTTPLLPLLGYHLLLNHYARRACWTRTDASGRVEHKPISYAAGCIVARSLVREQLHEITTGAVEPIRPTLETRTHRAEREENKRRQRERERREAERTERPKRRYANPVNPRHPDVYVTLDQSEYTQAELAALTRLSHPSIRAGVSKGQLNALKEHRLVMIRADSTLAAWLLRRGVVAHITQSKAA